MKNTNFNYIFFFLCFFSILAMGFSSVPFQKEVSAVVPTISDSTKNYKDKDIAAHFSKEKSNKNLSAFDKIALNEYLSLNDNSFDRPNLEAFKKAIKGYYKLKKDGIITKEIMTLIDFSQSSIEKRLWVIDMKEKTILFHSVVSHGRNSGLEYAEVFSNDPESHQSSLGFYKTAETYVGKNGLSLRLDGLEYGFNDRARERLIVMHGADYCDEKLAKNQGYLGRSYGCPSVPRKLEKQIIETIKEGSCLFIYHQAQEDYFKKSKFL